MKAISINICFLVLFSAAATHAQDEVTEIPPRRADSNENSALKQETRAPSKAPSKKKRSIKKRKRTRKCRSWASARYRRMKRNWQRVPKIPKPRYREGFRDLVVNAVNIGERARVFPFLPDGTLDPDAVDKMTPLFQDKDTGATHPLHPRLVKLLYKLADHFKARQINVISGYRDVNQIESESYHGKGCAADINLPGIPLGAVARKARQFGHVGVGFYPDSGFVHIDVRDGPSYFWVDRSGPGQRSCLRPILRQAAAKSDRRYREKNDAPKRHLNRKGIPLGAIQTPPDQTPQGATNGRISSDGTVVGYKHAE